MNCGLFFYVSTDMTDGKKWKRHALANQNDLTLKIEKEIEVNRSSSFAVLLPPELYFGQRDRQTF